ncbi:MAG TPA: 1-deoxy-D-xylulose-5-phosphate reductoisomerase [Acidobacteriota bacterium]|nr:1-deoxy-D-xylulose-5-phosphate reductoisomerase [Acidobacteriota bacterium]
MPPRLKNLAVLGSTGSIGTSTLSIVDLYPERFGVATLAANGNVDEIVRQCDRYSPRLVAMCDREAAGELRRRRPEVTVAEGQEGIVEAATLAEVDVVVAAVTGAAGLPAVYKALEEGKDVALANKETLIAAGEVIMAQVRRTGVRLIPIDSEHNALHQCLRGAKEGEVKRLWLTASGGPFHQQPQRDLSQVTVEQALDHPTWSMGPKITIDSATLMNKGLEVIEAHHLFSIPPRDIAIAVHPQSVIHSMVEFVDGTFLAQMSITDMRSAILYALCDPERCPSRLPEFDVFSLPALEFHRPDPQRFPCIRLAYEALRMGGTAPAVLNAANEVAVGRFLQGGLALTAIPEIIERTLQQQQPVPADSLQAVLEADRQARRLATQALNQFTPAPS